MTHKPIVSDDVSDTPVGGAVRKTTQEVICGDCLEVINTLEDNSVDCIIADPPFSSGARQTSSMRARKGLVRSDWQEKWFGTDNLSSLGFLFFMRGVLLSSFQKIKESGHIYLFIDWRNYPLLFQVMESAGFRVNNLIVWDKVHFGMGTNYRNQHELIIFASKGQPKESNNHSLSNVISIKRVRSEIHPTEKPVELLEKFVENSTNEGEVILDMFAGSGSTLVAAKKKGRNFIGIEISPEYCEIARQRLQQQTLL